MLTEEQRLCTVEDCDRKLYARLFCRMHYKRFLKHGDPSISLVAHHAHVSQVHTMKDKFEALIDKKESDQCWNWKGASCKLGYGEFNLHIGNKEYKKVRSNRQSYEYYIGPIPEGLFICHRCDNPSCVNPSHLFAATQKENLLDMSKKGRSLWGERGSKAKFTNEYVKQLRIRLCAGNETISSIADEHNVAESTIKRIKYNKTYINKECYANS